MTFQQTVNRNYTTGFPGELVKDGPTRAKTARITSATLGVDPGASTNRMSRAFGYSGDEGPQGTTYSALEQTAAVGAAPFFGILGNPKRYALLGTTSGGPLAPSVDLPLGEVGEFFDMATGLICELFNETTATKAMTYGDGIAFVPNTISTGNNPLALPYGALVSFPAGGSAPTGFTVIPNARLINTGSLAASGVGALISTYTETQLTQ